LAHSTSRAIGQAVSIYLAIGSCAVTAQDNRPGRPTFAEMIAYARLAVRACEHLALPPSLLALADEVIE
jgi:hypothetical protein